MALNATGDELFIGSGYGFGSIAPTTRTGTGRSYTDRVGIVSIVDVPNEKQLHDFTKQVRDNDKARLPVVDLKWVANSDNGGKPGGKDAAPGHSDPPEPQGGPKNPIPNMWESRRRSSTSSTSSRKTAPTIRCSATCRKATAIPRSCSSGATSRRITTRSPSSSRCSTTTTVPATSRRSGIAGCSQAYPSTWVHKYGNARNDQNPMLLGPTDAIYDSAKLHGLSVRSYGERGLNTITPATATWTDIYNDWKNGTTNVSIDARAVILGLRDVYHPHYPAAEAGVPDGLRADIFLKEFADFEKNGNLPRLVILLLYDDHTSGTSPGFPTPRAQVADNDLALGRIVEAISKSQYWKESAIFVTEDDSQDGLDHVDGHRTVGLAISPLHAARRRRQQLLHDRQHVPDDRADSRPAAVESVRAGCRADVLRRSRASRTSRRTPPGPTRFRSTK